MKEQKSKKEIPNAIKKTQLGETKMSKKNRQMLELIRSYKGMYI